MSPRHTTRFLEQFAWTLGAFSFLAGLIWIGSAYEWTRPWLIGWLLLSIVAAPPLCVLCSVNTRQDEAEGAAHANLAERV